MSYFVKLLVMVILIGQLVLAEEINLSGIYVVPTSDKSLIDAAQFKITQYKVLEPNSVEPVIQFTLPLELTGITNTLEFKRVMLVDVKDKSSLYVSPAGSALCYGAWKNLKCFFKFKDLEIDKIKAIDILSNLFRGKERLQKAAVMHVFDGEPVGILMIDSAATKP